MFKYFILFISIFFLSSCSIDKESLNMPSNISKTYSPEDLQENISYKDYITDQKKVILVLTNNNDVSINPSITITFYDENNNALNTETESLLYIAPHKDAAIEIYNTPKKYAKYEVSIDSQYYSKEDYTDKIELETKEEENSIVSLAINNNDVDLGKLKVAIIFYKDNNVVAYDIGLKLDLKKNKKVSYTFKKPLDTNYELIEYDDYKIFINEAY